MSNEIIKNCRLFVNTLITCSLEKKCIPERVSRANGRFYLRSPKAKKFTTKYLKNYFTDKLCK